MKNKISKYLSQPAPYINETPWFFILLTIVIAILVLCIFEPFEFNLDHSGQLIVLLYIVAVVLLCLIAFGIILPLLFKKFFNPEKWTLGKTLLTDFALLIAMGLGVTSLNYFVFITNLPEDYTPIFLIDMLASFTIGIIPLTMITFISYYRSLKRNLDSVLKINHFLSKQIKQNQTAPESITINSSTKEYLTVNPEEILYIESTGNYVTIHYISNGKIFSKMLRTTIKQVGELMKTKDNFIRCHRAFIVNVSNVCNMYGNAQGCKLSIKETDTQIPVSRSYIKVIHDLFESRSISK